MTNIKLPHKKQRSLRFCWDCLFVWMLIVMLFGTVRSFPIDDDYYVYNTLLRNQLMEQMEVNPAVRHYRQVPKRSTLIWNPLVIALQKALKPESEWQNKDAGVVSNSGGSNYPASSVKNMELLSGPNGKVYWRCYFNAVSCFTKK